MRAFRNSTLGSHTQTGLTNRRAAEENRKYSTTRWPHSKKLWVCNTPALGWVSTTNYVHAKKETLVDRAVFAQKRPKK